MQLCLFLGLETGLCKIDAPAAPVRFFKGIGNSRSGRAESFCCWFRRGMTGRLDGEELSQGLDFHGRQTFGLSLHAAAGEGALEVLHGQMRHGRTIGSARNSGLVATGTALAVEPFAFL